MSPLSHVADRAAELYRVEMERLTVPEHLREGLVRYLVGRIRPGGFLCAVLADDPEAAFARADDVSKAGIIAVATFLVRVAPLDAWGSYEKIERWLDRGLHRPDAHLGAVVENDVHAGER
jgi:hypothetical protein